MGEDSKAQREKHYVWGSGRTEQLIQQMHVEHSLCTTCVQVLGLWVEEAIVLARRACDPIPGPRTVGRMERVRPAWLWWRLFQVSWARDLVFCASFLFAYVFKICYEVKIVIIWNPYSCFKCIHEVSRRVPGTQ